MPDKPAHPIDARIDEFARRYRLWIAIPVVIACGLAFWNTSAAFAFMAFILSSWAFGGVIGLILWASGWILPKSYSPEIRKKIQESIDVTLFLGGFALLGVILRSENEVSIFVARIIPDGMSLGFVDPIFALICVVFVWVYTAYRIRK